MERDRAIHPNRIQQPIAFLKKPNQRPQPPSCPAPPARTAMPKSTSVVRSVPMPRASTTDPDARLYKKSPGTGAALCFIGHALMENRSGLIVQGELTQADGRAESQADRHGASSLPGIHLQADSRSRQAI